jgi:DNA-binding response OmpR family regulator
MASTAPAPLRILILDRDRQSLQMVRGCLERIPGRRLLVTACASVESALAAIAPRHPDLILMEQDLGDETGPRLLPVLRGLQCHSPVIMMSASGNAHAAVTALRAGAADYLNKTTLDPARLERAIQFALDKSRVEQRLSAQREQLLASHRELQTDHDQLRLGVDLLARDLTQALDALRGFLGAFPDEGALTADQSERLQQAVARCRGLRHLVVDLGMHLGDTRPDGAAAAAVTMSPREMLARALPPVLKVAEARGVKAEISVPASLPVITAPENLADLTARLLQFAIDGTAAGGTVRLQVHVEGDQVRLVVDDGAVDHDDEMLATMLQRLPADHSVTGLEAWKRGLPLRTAQTAMARIGGELRLECRGGSLRQLLVLPIGSPWSERSPAPAAMR